MKKAILFIFMLSLIFIGCQKVVDSDKLLDTEEKVSIIGYLSPNDTILRVNVSKALPSIGTPINVTDGNFSVPSEFLITNAIVTLSDDSGNSAQLNYSTETNTYLTDASSLAIESGREYFLNVQVDDKEFNSSCRIPEKIVEINETILGRTDEFGNDVAEINLSFQDFPRDTNFYMLGGLVEVTYQYEGEEPQTFTNFLFFDSDTFISDNINNGGTLSGSTFVYLGGDITILEAKLMLQVGHLEQILFQNLRSLDINADADGNPFVEYSIAPTNFLDDGAVGVFAGYQVTEKVIDLIN